MLDQATRRFGFRQIRLVQDPLEEADRLLAADIEKFRSRAKRLAARLERVKRMRIAARENFD